MKMQDRKDRLWRDVMERAAAGANMSVEQLIKALNANECFIKINFTAIVIPKETIDNVHPPINRRNTHIKKEPT